ncbi:12843_t:CDS:2 [Cetraspora pellucida]|uniref:12843_t:CDS:1 n=1 Tax=Cetraspora pellucida TaxID=1433469 RepID=A0A9N9F291_9GLOM|nr:12843_t:CDS:2 [Cetraspora pellucida]
MIAEIEQHQEQGIMHLCTKQIQHHPESEQGWELNGYFCHSWGYTFARDFMSQELYSVLSKITLVWIQLQVHLVQFTKNDDHMTQVFFKTEAIDVDIIYIGQDEPEFGDKGCLFTIMWMNYNLPEPTGEVQDEIPGRVLEGFQ